MSLEGAAGLMRNAVRDPLDALPNVESAEPALQSPGRPFDRRPVATQEPERSSHDASDEQEGERSQQKHAEPENRQQPGEQEPDPGERQNALANLLAIERSRPRHQIPLSS